MAEVIHPMVEMNLTFEEFVALKALVSFQGSKLVFWFALRCFLKTGHFSQCTLFGKLKKTQNF